MDESLVPHLFRTTFGKITAVLCKRFGLEHLAAAEDIASETFLSALETWPYQGVPEKPSAWLYAVAKNKARNYVRRRAIFNTRTLANIFPDDTQDPDIDLTPANITDSQLQMMFALSHPLLGTAAQVGLSLRILCGFGIEEIANALLTNKETINKRLLRAKETLRSAKIELEFPPESALPTRLNGVLLTLYLLFNEGYYSESNDAVLREELCFEAMRLTRLLLDHPMTSLPETHALLALMCFHASRFPARKNDRGEIVLYENQDETLWNSDLIAEGARHLHHSATGTHLSKYHLEATIAWWHTVKEDTPDKWSNILRMYDYLLQLEYAPVAAINSIYAFSKVHGKRAAIGYAATLSFPENLYYHTLMGDLFAGIDADKAKQHLEKALHLAKTPGDKRSIQQKLDANPANNGL